MKQGSMRAYHLWRCHRVAIQKKCNKVGCSQLIPRGQQPPYCKEHLSKMHKTYDTTKRNQKAKAFYSSARWTRLATSIRHEYLFRCTMCGASGNTVHHIEPISTTEGWERRFDRTNLTLVCMGCHAKIHKEKSPFFHK